MPKYDFSYGKLNNIKLPKTARSYDLDESTHYGSAVKASEMAYTPDILEDTGPYKAVVLRVEPINSGEAEPEGFLDFVFDLFSSDDKPAGSTIKKMTQIKARVPELHGHIPIPTQEGDPQTKDYKDHHIIDMYPTYTSEADREEFSKVKPGDIVIVDYGDKENFADPIYVTPIAVQQHIPPMSVASGQGTFSNLPCALPSGEIVGQAMAGGTDSSNHTGLNDHSHRARSISPKAIVFGDEGLATSLGTKVIRNGLIDLGYKIVKSSNWPDSNTDNFMIAGGSAISSWVLPGGQRSPASAGKFDFVADAIKEHNPQVAVIHVGATGFSAGNFTKLVTKINNLAPNMRILWFGPIPPSKITSMSEAKRHGFISQEAQVTPMHFVDLYDETRRAIDVMIGNEYGSQPASLSSGGEEDLVTYISCYNQLGYGKTWSWQENPGNGASGMLLNHQGAMQIAQIFEGSNEVAKWVVNQGKSARKPKYPNKAGPTPGSGTTFLSKEDMLAILERPPNYISEFQTQESAWEFLSKMANLLSTSIDDILSRDWYSGFLAKLTFESIDVSKWQPMRLSELAVINGYTSWNETNIPGAPYGIEVSLPNLTGPGASDPTVNLNPDPHITKHGTRDITPSMKNSSREMASAIYVYTYGPPGTENPMTTQSPVPPCRPIQTYSDSGATTPEQMAPVGPEVDAGGTGKPFQKPPPRTLNEIDWSAYPQWMINKWGRGRGFSSNWNSLGDEVKHKSMMSFAAAEVLERYWRQIFPNCQVHIKSHLRRRPSGSPPTISKNHGYGAAMDWEVRYQGKYLPNLYTWASSQYLMNANRLPKCGAGTYLNMNIPQSDIYKPNNPPGVAGIAISEQGKASAPSCPAPGSATNTHFDYRGYASHKPGTGRAWWLHIDRNGDSRDDITSRTKVKNWLLQYHPKGQLIWDFINSWIQGTNMQPPDFKFPQMSNAVPNWNQVSGQEPFGAGDVS